MKLPLKKLRENKQITQAELSKLMDVAPSTIGLWEQGRREPNYDTLNKIADFYEVTTDYLLGREKDPPPVREESQLLQGFRSLTDEGKRIILTLIKQMIPAK